MKKNLYSEKGKVKLIGVIGAILIFLIIFFLVRTFLKNNEIVQAPEEDIYENDSNTIIDTTTNTTTNSNLSQAEIEAFNAQFLIYQGEMDGTSISTLKDSVEANNSTSEHYVEFVCENDIEASKQYTVVISYAKDGLIDKIEAILITM